MYNGTVEQMASAEGKADFLSQWDTVVTGIRSMDPAEAAQAIKDGMAESGTDMSMEFSVTFNDDGYDSTVKVDMKSGEMGSINISGKDTVKNGAAPIKAPEGYTSFEEAYAIVEKLVENYQELTAPTEELTRAEYEAKFADKLDADKAHCFLAKPTLAVELDEILGLKLEDDEDNAMSADKYTDDLNVAVAVYSTMYSKDLVKDYVDADKAIEGDNYLGVVENGYASFYIFLDDCTVLVSASSTSEAFTTELLADADAYIKEMISSMKIIKL